MINEICMLKLYVFINNFQFNMHFNDITKLLTTLSYLKLCCFYHGNVFRMDVKLKLYYPSHLDCAGTLAEDFKLIKNTGLVQYVCTMLVIY